MQASSTPDPRPASGDEAPDRVTDAAFLRAILERAPDMVGVVDRHGRVIYSTPSVTDLIGYEPSERMGRSIFELMHPDDQAAQRAAFEALVAEPGATWEGEFRVRHRDGSIHVLRSRGRNLLADPTVRGILYHVRDVTDQRAAEQERDDVRTLLGRVVAHVPLVLFVVNTDGVFELAEGRGLAAIGLEPGQAVGRNVFEDFRDAEQGLELIRRALEGEEVEGETPVGDRLFHTVVTPVRGPEGSVTAALGVSFDITDRIRQARRAGFRARLLDAVGEAVIATDLEGTVQYWNRAAEELFGWSAEEAVGSDMVTLMAPEGHEEAAAEIMEELRARRRWTGEYTVRLRDGTRIPIYVVDVPLVEDGRVAGVIRVSTDLRERKALEEQLIHAQKMEAVGRLAGGIAHDFNNLLTAIGGYARMAVARAEDGQLAADIGEVLNATERARSLVNKLLTFSRRTEAEPRSVDVDGLIERMAGMLRRMIGADIRFETSLAARPWRAYTDAVQLEQMVMNLTLNARDAMPDGGTISLRTDRVALDADRIRGMGRSLEPGPYLRIILEDTGTGIDPAIQGRIFEPFFTTKEVGQGSGLGLSMVFGALQRVGGAVVVESKPGEGTRIVVYVPRAGRDDELESTVEAPVGRGAPVTGVAGRPGTAAEPRAPATVLLVEDETAVRALARRVLEREGYEVLEADTGVTAERVLETAGGAPDLLLTDVIMPEMGGPELAQRLERVNPRVRVLYMSGYTADELASRGIDERTVNFLPKPFTPAQLADAVRSALED